MENTPLKKKEGSPTRGYLEILFTLLIITYGNLAYICHRWGELEFLSDDGSWLNGFGTYYLILFSCKICWMRIRLQILQYLTFMHPTKRKDLS